LFPHEEALEAFGAGRLFRRLALHDFDYLTCVRVDAFAPTGLRF
jgi:hypothetical protein